MTTVAIIGGGIAGLTAAQELRERRFDVTVYERRTVFGGKARSYYSKTAGIKGLPAEHGFRFFPSFYRNVRDSMARTPGLNGSVASDLVEVPEGAMARLKNAPFSFPTRRPRDLNEFCRSLQTAFSNSHPGLRAGEATFAANKILAALSMSRQRRDEELDKKSWWNFMEADRMSPAYRAAIVDGLTQNFVAMDARQSSTKTVTTILARMFNDFWSGTGMDWILAGPTSEIWIDPWREFLETSDGDAIGVKFRKNVHAVSFILNDNEIVGIRKRSGDEPEGSPPDADPITANYYLLCVPLEAARRIIAASFAGNDIKRFPALAKMMKDALSVNWMAGISFYTKTRMGLLPGHVAYIDSAWALTSIAPSRYWRRTLSSYKTPEDDADGAPEELHAVPAGADEAPEELHEAPEELHEAPEELHEAPEELNAVPGGADEAPAELNDAPGGAGEAPDEAGDDADDAPDDAGEEQPGKAGEAHEVISVIVSDFFRGEGNGGVAPRPARQALPFNLVAEVLAQLQKHQPGIPALSPQNIVGHEVDSSLSYFVRWRPVGLMPLGLPATLAQVLGSGLVGKTMGVETFERMRSETPARLAAPEGAGGPTARYITIGLDNAEPLFINTVNSTANRPDVDVGFANLFLAADYVKTDTDLACMEGANEAGRRAVNAILAKEGRSSERVRVFTHDEALVFDLPQAIDEWAASGGMANPAEAVFAIALRIRKKVARFLRQERVLPPRRKHKDEDLGVDEKE